MVRGKVVSLPGHIQAIYVHNMLKLYAHIIATAEEEDDTEMIEEVCSHLGLAMEIYDFQRLCLRAIERKICDSITLRNYTLHIYCCCSLSEY